MSDLPDGWNWVKLAEIVHSLSNGRSVPDGPDTGYPVLRLTAIRSGLIDITASKNGDWAAEDARQFRINKGDYLVARGNGSKHLVGRGGIVREDAEIAFPDTMIRIRFDKTRVYPSYAAAVWGSPSVRVQIENAARTSAGIYKVSQKDLREIQIPLPPIEEQKRISGTIEEHFSLLDAGVSAISAASQKLTILRTSALRSAMAVPAGTPSMPARDLFSWASGKRFLLGDSHHGRYPAFGGNGITGYADKFLNSESTMVIGRVGALCGNVYLTGGPAWITDNAIYARSHSDSIFLPYVVLVFRNARLRDRAGGTGQPFVNQRILNEIQVPMISVERQTETVAQYEAAEAVFSYTEHLLKNLVRRASRLRASILAAAFSGKLT